MRHLILFLFLIPSISFAVGFSTGNEFTARPITGKLQVICPASAKSSARQVSFECHDTVLAPVTADYFVGPAGVDADTVMLTAAHPNGTTRAKASSYDSSILRSEDRFNLWGQSILQRGLLMEGLNDVKFDMKKGNVVVNQGQFQARVTKAPLSQCQPKSYNASSASDCDNQFTMCGRYFADQNFCN